MNRAQGSAKPWIIGITGASGAVYGVRLCEFMLSAGLTIHIVVSDAGWRVLHEELGWSASKRKDTIAEHFAHLPGIYHYHPLQDIGASIASGSFQTEGMVVIPCSMGTLAGIAHGMSDNLMKRAADVMLKENRKLIIVPRETPLHSIHLQNMLALSNMGVTILPAMPAFYFKPQTLEDSVSFLVGKVLDAMGIEHQLFKRWGVQYD